MSSEAPIRDSAGNADAAVELLSVTKRYGVVVATDDVSISIRKGECCALLGPSGCGKTTILRMIAGFEQPTEGRIRISGADVAGSRPYERSVGILFQQYALFPHMTVADNIGYGLRHRGWPRAERTARVEEMLSLVRMDSYGGRWPSELSGGQQQRVALARALATNPDIVLLDEPLSALDAQLRQTLRMELKEILGAVSATVLLVTHDQEEAMTFADRILVMRGGRVEQEGFSEALYFQPQTRFVAEFIGKSNWIENATLKGNTNDMASFRTARGTIIRTRTSSTVTADLCVRPEHIALVTEDTSEPDSTILNGTVVDRVHVGADYHLVVRTDEGDFTVFERVGVGTASSRGHRVRIRIRPHDWIVLPAGFAVQDR